MCLFKRVSCMHLLHDLFCRVSAASQLLPDKSVGSFKWKCTPVWKGSTNIVKVLHMVEHVHIVRACAYAERVHPQVINLISNWLYWDHIVVLAFVHTACPNEEGQHAPQIQNP